MHRKRDNDMDHVLQLLVGFSPKKLIKMTNSKWEKFWYGQWFWCGCKVGTEKKNWGPSAPIFGVEKKTYHMPRFQKYWDSTKHNQQSGAPRTMHGWNPKWSKMVQMTFSFWRFFRFQPFIFRGVPKAGCSQVKCQQHAGAFTFAHQVFGGGSECVQHVSTSAFR